MGAGKAAILEKLDQISDGLGEMEIIGRLYLLSRLEHSMARCKREGTMPQKSGKHPGRYALEWSPDAIDDLDAAGMVAEELRQQAKALRKHPQIWAVIPELGRESFREYQYKKCNIIYEITEATILVHEIYNCSCIFDRSFYVL